MEPSKNSEIIFSTWAQFKSIDPTFENHGRELFIIFFEQCPEALKLFSFKDEPNLKESEKLKKHGASVWKYIDMAVNQRDKSEKSLKDLGTRHVPRGTMAEHYDAIGNAVITYLKKVFGDAMTLEVENCWKEFYRGIANTMKSDHYS